MGEKSEGRDSHTTSLFDWETEKSHIIRFGIERLTYIDEDKRNEW